MNITRALNAALPEIPARTLVERYPRVPPDIVHKETDEDGVPLVRVFVRSQDAMYKFPPQNWALVELFDGRRSYEEIANIYSRQRGAEYSVEEVREFAATLDSMEFWYKTPQEKNILLMQKSAEERKELLKSKKNKYGDLSQILFPAVNPDKFLTWLHGKTSFIYTPWFTLLTLGAFGCMAAITVAHWSEIGRDSLQFFNFADKSWGDVAVFYVVAIISMCWHELGHGHACKHFGGKVPAMGFLLIYLTPAFYTDTTEGHVLGTRTQRFVISLAGAWAELYICAVATVVWWLTPPDTAAHSVAYMMVLITGIASILINFNPLMKLDGYYMLSEIIGIADLKENSTAYVSAWVKRHIWRLPVEVPYVPKRRRLGFAVYALLSGLYSYTVLYVLARFVGNVFRNFNPDWSFIPELGTAALIFRSRIRTLVNFVRFVYLDKKDRVRSWLHKRQAAVLAAIILLLLILPLSHQAIEGSFVLEPAVLAEVRNPVAGTVTSVYAKEGMWVSDGTPLAQLRNLPLESKLARIRSDYALATMRATDASLRYVDFGSALQRRNQLAQESHDLSSEIANLTVRSPISGEVLTPHLGDRIGAYLPEGVVIAEIGDPTRLRARIYVSEHDLYKLHLGEPARLHVDGFFKKWDAQPQSISPLSSEIDSSLSAPVKYKGLHPPNFYVVDLFVDNPDGKLRPGMTGTARIHGQRRSLLRLGLDALIRFSSRKLW